MSNNDETSSPPALYAAISGTALLLLVEGFSVPTTGFGVNFYSLVLFSFSLPLNVFLFFVYSESDTKVSKLRTGKFFTIVVSIALLSFVTGLVLYIWSINNWGAGAFLLSITISILIGMWAYKEYE